MALVLGEELDRGQQGLDVLLLVLHDHGVDEAVVQQRLGPDGSRSAAARTSSAWPRTSSPYAAASAGPRIGSADRPARGCLNAS